MTTYDRPQLFIGGEWVEPESTEEVVVNNPATGEVVGRAALGDSRDLAKAVDAARRTFDQGGVWRDTDPKERGEVLRRASELLQERADELAVGITSELGCPIWFSQAAHVPNPIRHTAYYGDLASSYEFEEVRTDGTNRSLVVQEPVGVAAGIVPWNGPLSGPSLKIAPALAAGCSIVLKPAPETPFSAYAFADVMTEAGLPKGVLSIVPAGREAGQSLVDNPGVDKIAFTGSTAAGKQIAASAAARVARVTLELGGKSAAIVLDDADLDATIAKLLPMALNVNGQMCIAQTRVLVPASREKEVLDALAAALESQVVGNPLDPTTTIGPLISQRQQERVRGYISLAREEGARVVTGGERITMPSELANGWFVPPTLLADVNNAMRVAREEIFGPVLAVIPYGSEEEAVAIANDSPYGLSGSVWTADADRGLAIARRIRTGMVSVNGSPQAYGSPFGGFKESGLGREMGPEGLRSYLEVKSVALGA
ncbi:betaine-aldehyde dehydrogenase [Nocardioides sp. J9]|uniref:aldehyde dehydrogenase n=1 Tax=Nocardioides sp. J9 TaxID=935844 RepID=UPI0011A9FBDC|nr:aldehyde dehydrogenase [Nocardioides sp. J9]TWG94795.1 betaine-aldehyde dehydrogenase [Nocardioides sp. J9]